MHLKMQLLYTFSSFFSPIYISSWGYINISVYIYLYIFLYPYVANDEYIFGFFNLEIEGFLICSVVRSVSVISIISVVSYRQ